MNADDLDAIRARAEAARQAAASGTTGTPPNVDGLSINDALDIFAESAADVPALLEEVETLREGIATGDRMLNQAMLRAEGAEAEVEQLREYIDRMPYPSDLEQVTAERDRAREECGYEKKMRAFLRDELDRFIAAKVRAEADRDDLEDRLSLFLWELTDCKLSKSGYDVRTMVSEIEGVFERYAEEDRAELQAERDRLAAALDRVRALADEASEHLATPLSGGVTEVGIDAPAFIRDLRAAIEGTGS